MFETSRTIFMYICLIAIFIAMAVVIIKNIKNIRKRETQEDIMGCVNFLLTAANFIMVVFGSPIHDLKAVATALVIVFLGLIVINKDTYKTKIVCVTIQIIIFVCFISVFPNKP